jgi:hypothetical protein
LARRRRHAFASMLLSSFPSNQSKRDNVSALRKPG